MMLSVGSGQLQVPASRRQQSARWLASTEDRWLFVGIGLTWQPLLGGLSTRTPAYPTSGSSRRSGGRARGRGKGTRRALPYRRSPCLRRSASRVTDYGQRALASCPPGSSVPPSTPGGVIRRRTTDNGDTLRVTDRDPNEASISRSSAIAPGSRPGGDGLAHVLRHSHLDILTRPAAHPQKAGHRSPGTPSVGVTHTPDPQHPRRESLPLRRLDSTRVTFAPIAPEGQQSY
jgi:hypothetical protein